MKKFKPTYLLIFTLLIAWALFSNCSKEDDPVSPTDALAGTWNLTSVIVTFTQDSVITYSAQDLLGGTLRLVINSNSTYQVTTTTAQGTETESGTWSTSGNQLTITPQGGEPGTIEYSQSGNTLRIIQTIQFEEGGSQYPSVWVFTKQ